MEGLVQSLVVQRVTELGQARCKAVASRVLAEDEQRLGHTDRLRFHDFVGFLVLEDAVLVDAGLVGKGVVADDSFVWLHQHARDGTDQLRGAADVAGVDARRKAKELAPCLEGHHDLLEGSVPGPLADAVDRNLRLTSAGLQTGERVRGGHAEVVVAVDGDDGVFDSPDLFLEAGDGFGEFRRRRVADGVRDVDGPRAGLDGRLDHLAEKIELGATGVLGAELDVLTALAGVGNHRPHFFKHLFLAHPQLVLPVDWRGGDEGVDPPMGGRGDGFQDSINVRRTGAGKTADRWWSWAAVVGIPAADLLCDGLDRQEIVGRSGRETGLDDVDTEAGKRTRDLQLLTRAHGGPRRLFAVAQGGIEDSYVL